MEYRYPHSWSAQDAREPGFSSEAQGKINRAFRILHADDSDQRYSNACRELDDVVIGKLSKHQWMDALYLLGEMRWEQSYQADGLCLLEDSLALAYHLHDTRAIVELAFRIGMLNRAISRFAAMVEYLQRAYFVMRAIDLRVAPELLSLEIRVCAHLGFAEFNRGDLLATRRWLHEAERAALLGTPESGDRALVHWAWAEVHRAEEQPERGLPYADLAVQHYAGTEQLGALARIQSVATEIALDCAERMPEQSDARDALIHAALRYSRDSGTLGLVGNDSPAAGLGALAQARELRMGGGDGNRMAILLGVIDFAGGIEDAALLGQAYTALGDDLLAKGEFGPARNLYGKSLDTLHGKDMDGLKFGALRGLRRLDRMGS